MCKLEGSIGEATAGFTYTCPSVCPSVCSGNREQRDERGDSFVVILFGYFDESRGYLRSVIWKTSISREQSFRRAKDLWNIFSGFQVDPSGTRGVAGFRVINAITQKLSRLFKSNDCG